MQQQPDQLHVLRAAARMAYAADSPAKHKLAQHLLKGMTDGTQQPPSPISMDGAAAAAGIPASALLAVLRSDSCFVIKKASSQYSVTLSPAALLAKGRKNTKAGVLAEELPPPVGYVDTLHPIRPGRPMCFHWESYGRCAFNRICVFNHQEQPPGSSQGRQQQRPAQRTPTPGGYRMHAQRDAGVLDSSSGDFGSQFEAEQPAFWGDAHASILSPSAAGAEAGASPAAGVQQQQQQQQQQQPARPATPSARPGAAPCPVFRIRGFCPQGERCVYDHPLTSPGSGAGGSKHPPDSQQQQQQQQQSAQPAAASSSAASSRSPSPLPPPGTQPGQQQQQQWQQKQQQQQQQQQQKPHKREFPPMGLNEYGFPMYRSAPCCAYYLGTGSCDFRLRCKFHHPNAVLLPECVVEGVMPKKYNTHHSASYSRLVSHLQRLWDYECCVEAQLKTWLAHHLLARENTGCSMFSATAALPAVDQDAPHVRPSADKPKGAYSCTLKEAEQVLQLLWKAQPDAAASSPMPYSGSFEMEDLLAGDPYFELCAGPGVKLKVQTIKKLLNF